MNGGSGHCSAAWRGIVAGGLLLAGAAGPALAQGSPDRDIIVTAQKRAENVQDVPISIAVLSGSALDAYSITDMKAALDYIPNLYVQTTAGADTIYIRGFGSPPANYAFDQSVSLFLDGIYAGRARQSGAQLFDIERVEVVRGPQGALFGKNTPAGAISIISAGPSDTPEMAVQARYDFSRHGPSIEGHATGALATGISARLAFRVGHEDGYIENGASNRKDPSLDEQMLRATLRLQPAEQFDYTVKFEYVNREFLGGATVSSPATTAQQPHFSRYVSRHALGDEGDRNRSYLLSATGNLSLGEFTLQSITGGSWFHAERTNGYDQTDPATGAILVNSVYNQYPERFHQFSEELRLLSPEHGALQYVLGAYYDNSSYRMRNNTGFNLPWMDYLGTQHSDFDQWSRTISVYGQGTLQLAPPLRLIGSLRYTSTRKRADFTSALDSGPYALRPISSASGRRSDENVDPSLTLQFDLAKGVMLYATYGAGSKAGGFVANTFGVVNTPALNTFEFNGEKSRNFEGGLKSSFLDDRITANLTVYDTRFHDLQVSVFNPVASTYVTGNAATATSRGVEAELVLRPFSGVDLRANAAWQDLKYNDFPGALCLSGMVPGPDGTCNLAGRRPVLASKFMGSVQAHGGFAVGRAHRVDLTASLAGRSKFMNADNQDPVYGEQPGYAKVDGRLEYSRADGRWHVALVGRNLTDKRTTSSSFLLPAPYTTDVSRVMLYMDPPRSVAVEAGLRF